MRLTIAIIFLVISCGTEVETPDLPEIVEAIPVEPCPTRGIYVVEYVLEETECHGRFPRLDIDDVVLDDEHPYSACGTERTIVKTRKWVAWDCFMDVTEIATVKQESFVGSMTIFLYCGDWGRANGWPETCAVRYKMSGVFDRLNEV